MAQTRERPLTVQLHRNTPLGVFHGGYDLASLSAAAAALNGAQVALTAGTAFSEASAAAVDTLRNPLVQIDRFCVVASEGAAAVAASMHLPRVLWALRDHHWRDVRVLDLSENTLTLEAAMALASLLAGAPPFRALPAATHAFSASAHSLSASETAWHFPSPNRALRR